jgi:hypothetical protein
MALIKSHSNYVLKKKHQKVTDGTIWERDITTIGGVNQFARGQVPIFRDNNFIITVRNDGSVANQYNRTNWKESSDGSNSTVWTLQTISAITSEFDDQNDTKIVLKQDYYDFCDFAYYGSLSELFRASITDILLRFPGELYGSKDHVYYTKVKIQEGERVETETVLGGNSYYEVKNPFGIDIHTKKLPVGANPLKYFADDGYKEYMFYSSDSAAGEAVTYSRGNMKECAPAGTKMGEVTINGKTIYVYAGNNGAVHYLCTESGFHIRPKETYLADFYNGCDNFQKLLMNPKTTPKYKATFSVIKEDDYGYHREMRTFIFPTGPGGYNIDASSYGFNNYTNDLAMIGEFYDERFTDNLWRSMTHEAIKNFDWTYTREYEQGEEEEFVLGGEKMQKALRVFAREFDEIKTYIDNITSVNRITYDDRGNIPNYFLTDVCEDDGWDVIQVVPYDVSLAYIEYNNKRYYIGEDFTCTINSIVYQVYYLKNGVETKVTKNSELTTNAYIKIDNTKYYVKFDTICEKHKYVQNTKKEIKPYNSIIKGNDGTDIKNGYFISCCSGDGVSISSLLCEYSGNTNYYVKVADANQGTFYDSCVDKLKNRIRSFSDTADTYTYMDVNNEFLRRLKLNSRYIWRHKGTQEGIEMILAMFGLKSKRWYDKQEVCGYKKSKTMPSGSTINYDYEIKEYTRFSTGLTDPWDSCHSMYKYDWVNSTKTITYDYRTVSAYNTRGTMGITYIPYQGLPVAYDDNNGTRKLYPKFNHDEQYDGNPYFQMNGGWLSKKIVTADTNGNTSGYSFQFDVDNVPVYETNGDIFKETIRNIRRVETLNDLLAIPSSQVKKNSICYVEDLTKKMLIVDGEAFDVRNDVSNLTYVKHNDNKYYVEEETFTCKIGETSYNTYYLKNGTQTRVTTIDELRENSYIKIGNKKYYVTFVKDFITLTRNNGMIRVGDKYFNTEISVYGRDGELHTYYLPDKLDGYPVNAYIIRTVEEKDNKEVVNYSFNCSNGNYSIDLYRLFSPSDSDTESNYFILNDESFSNTIAISSNQKGWERLNKNSYIYKKINTIWNYYKGNNPHSGNMSYDNGEEYYEYFKHIFKNAYENDLFDERCYNDYYNEIDDIYTAATISVNSSDSGDTKVHYFGNYSTAKQVVVELNDDGTVKSRIYNNTDKTGSPAFTSTTEAKAYLLKHTEIKGYVDTEKGSSYRYETDYSIGGGIKINGEIQPYTSTDSVTNQIINNKKFTIIFKIGYPYDSNDKEKVKLSQAKLKFIDEIVMNYLTQLIPSTTIVGVEYEFTKIPTETEIKACCS